MGIKVSDLYDCNTCINLSKTPSISGMTCKCSSVYVKHRELFSKIGSKAAKKCSGYKGREYNTEDIDAEDIKENLSSLIEMEDALELLLGGDNKFIFHSTKTNEDFWYRITKKELSDGKNYIYFIHLMNNDKEVYAGNITYLNSSNTYNYRQGKAGTVESSDIRIKSLLFVLNNLNNKNYEMKLQIFKIS